MERITFIESTIGVWISPATYMNSASINRIQLFS